LEGRSCGMFWGIVLTFTWRDWRKGWKDSVRTVSWTRFEPGTSQIEMKSAALLVPYWSIEVYFMGKSNCSLMIEMNWELCLLRGTVINMSAYLLVVACSHLSSLKALPNCKSIQWLFWCQCSVTCGDGIRQRAVTCMDLSRGTPVDKSYCTEAMYVRTEEFCRRPACASWRVGDWTFCSVSCGKVTSVLLCMFPTL
jgi:hypothetical protein